MAVSGTDAPVTGPNRRPTPDGGVKRSKPIVHAIATLRAACVPWGGRYCEYGSTSRSNGRPLSFNALRLAVLERLHGFPTAALSRDSIMAAQRASMISNAKNDLFLLGARRGHGVQESFDMGREFELSLAIQDLADR
jgi:hypothetical protein